MKTINNILVALAFSDHVQHLFNYAADLATFLDAKLVAATVISERDVEAVRKISAMGYEVDGEHYVAGVREERKQALERIVLASGFPAEKVSRIFKIGKPVNELLRIIVENDIDLVVMGIKEHTDVEHFLVGSVAEKLFRRSPVPVVSYRHEKQAERLKKRIHL